MAAPETTLKQLQQRLSGVQKSRLNERNGRFHYLLFLNGFDAIETQAQLLRKGNHGRTLLARPVPH
jgi:hypothetical protein